MENEKNIQDEPIKSAEGSLEKVVDEKRNNVEDSNPKFIKRFFASILDQAILFALAVVVLIIFDLIVKVIGYEVAMPAPMLLIAYAVMNILYVPLFEKKTGKSFGKCILAIKK